jgi:hypothetical protein
MISFASMFRLALLAALTVVLVPAQTDVVKPVPPPGITVSDADRAVLTAGLQRLSSEVDALNGLPLVKDVRVFRDAVRFALEYNEFFKP